MNPALARRVRAAFWSRFWLVLSVVVSWFSFVFSPDVEGFLEAGLLTGMSMIEFQVYRLFRAGDMRAAEIGWWNQCIFAGLFVIYGVYHGTFVTISPALQQTVDIALQLNGLDESSPQTNLHDEVRWFYYLIAVVGGAGQFSLARFYRHAQTEQQESP